MKPDIAIADLLFGVEQVPVEAVIGTDGHTRRLTIPGKKSPDQPAHRPGSGRRQPGLPRRHQPGGRGSGP